VVYTYVCIYVHMCVCVYVCMYVCTYVCNICVCNVCMSICKHLCVCVCVCVCVCMYIYVTSFFVSLIVERVPSENVPCCVIYGTIAGAFGITYVCNFCPLRITKMVKKETCTGCSKHMYQLSVYPATNALKKKMQPPTIIITPISLNTGVPSSGDYDEIIQAKHISLCVTLHYITLH
jgi:hypothetical protein